MVLLAWVSCLLLLVQEGLRRFPRPVGCVGEIGSVTWSAFQFPLPVVSVSRRCESVG